MKRRGYRNGLPSLRLRVIGMDLLIANKESFKEHSQTFKYAKYADATLVTSLGGVLRLPTEYDYDGNPSFDKTNKGRFSQRSARDISELFIGLYHKEDGEWKLASNVVQVRGRNSGKTKIWEFDRTNVIADADA